MMSGQVDLAAAAEQTAWMDGKDNAAHGEYKVPGGKLVVVDLTAAEGRMSRVQVSGDFFLEPASALDDINAALEGLPVQTGEAALAAVVAGAMGPAQAYGITPEGVAAAVRRALDAAGQSTSGKGAGGVA